MAINKQRQPILITASRFQDYLQKWNLTNSDVARIFHVRTATVGQWAKSGVAGAAAMAIVFFELLCEHSGKSALEVARAHHIKLRGFPRGPYSQKGNVDVSAFDPAKRPPMPDKRKIAKRKAEAKPTPTPEEIQLMIRGEL